MLYSTTGWVDYKVDNEIINLYLNLRNISRYIAENKDNLNIIYNKSSFFSNNKNKYNYINLDGIFEMDKVSYAYRKILDRFKSKNIKDLTTFFDLLDDVSDFFLFIDKIDKESSDFHDKCKVSINNDKKIVECTKLNTTFTIEQSVIENMSKSGSIILDLLEKTKNDKFIKFYSIDIKDIYKGKFISGENPKLTLEEEIVISDLIDHLLIHLNIDFKYTLLSRIYMILRHLYGGNVLTTISDNLENGIILYTENYKSSKLGNKMLKIGNHQ